ncbi:MAG: tRNA (adenosine(37)-N6)-threonylcarbamoyltransferase complex ATPase subunit type 1 TsaE [Oscillospiraceae bacterium]|nr:tRNA (adenosine(37)-N6)-threonylcarbamoyltransferase complex ATPase subunit type 1 TsaE [Oscillospiraceae bacterium]
MTIRTRNEAETEAVGRVLAERLEPGDVIAYRGDLGAGKTALTRGIAAGLGISGRVTSPTYTIVNEYTEGRIPLFHFDLYRLSGEDELMEIGWEEYLDRGGVCAVEWTENAESLFADAIRVTITRPDSDPDTREITIEGGARFETVGL